MSGFTCSFAIIWRFPPCSSVGKESACKAGDPAMQSFIPGWGRSPGEGNGNPLQFSCLKNPMDRGAWRATLRGVMKSQMRLKWLSTCAHLEAKASFFFLIVGVYLLLPSCTPFDLSEGGSAFEQVDSLLKVALSGKVSSFAKWRIIPSISPPSSALPTFCSVSRMPALKSSIYSWCETSSRNSYWIFKLGSLSFHIFIIIGNAFYHSSD